MKKTTLLLTALFMCCTIFSTLAQTTSTETVVIDLSSRNSWDALDDSNNEIFTVILDGLAATSPCENPVLEVTGIGWDVTVSTVGPSWLSEMRTGFDMNQDGVRDLFISPGIADDNNGGNASTAYSSGGILDLSATSIGILPVANATSGEITVQLFEGFDDLPDEIDALWESGNMTIEYRLTCDSALSLENYTNELFSIFPNPASDVLNIKSSLDIDTVVIHNLLGKSVASYQGAELSNNSIDISNFQEGMYFVSVSAEGKSETFKITKK